MTFVTICIIIPGNRHGLFNKPNFQYRIWNPPTQVIFVTFDITISLRQVNGKTVLNLIGDLEKFEEDWRIAQQEELAALNPKQEEFNAVEAMIIQAEAEAVEIGQALKRATGLVAKSLEQNMSEVDQRYDALCHRLDTLQAELVTNDAIQEMVEFAQDVFFGIENAGFQTKRRNLEMLKVQVIVDNGKFTIYSLAGKISGAI